MKTSAYILSIIATIIPLGFGAQAQKVEPLPFGNMNQWVTRNIKESGIIGGKEKSLYEIGPTATINGNTPYKPSGASPWGTSNVLAKVAGIYKGSNAVSPDVRNGNDRCAKLSTLIEQCRAAGLVNIDVLVGGSIFLGTMLEPVTSTKNPYSKMEMGMPFTKRPKALRFDYKLDNPPGKGRIYSSGFGKKKQLQSNDAAEVYVLLQRRWEDADGNIYAKRVGTGRQRFGTSTKGWVNNHDMPIWYGDITTLPGYKPYMGLIPDNKSYYARNSRGEMVPVHEVGWDEPDATPTHIMVMASSASGTAYIGTPGLTFWIDNFALVY